MLQHISLGDIVSTLCIVIGSDLRQSTTITATATVTTTAATTTTTTTISRFRVAY